MVGINSARGGGGGERGGSVSGALAVPTWSRARLEVRHSRLVTSHCVATRRHRRATKPTRDARKCALLNSTFASCLFNEHLSQRIPDFDTPIRKMSAVIRAD